MRLNQKNWFLAEYGTDKNSFQFILTFALIGVGGI